MEFDAFEESLGSDLAPEGVDGALLALWWDGKGDWEQAHRIAQQVGGKEGDWVHGYLHRKEGDEGNASYWYARCGESFPDVSLDEEWKELVQSFLA